MTIKTKLGEANLGKEEALALIRQHVQKEIDLLNRKMRADEAFDKPAWSERQANLLGSLKFAHKLLDCLPDQGN